MNNVFLFGLPCVLKRGPETSSWRFFAHWLGCFGVDILGALGERAGLSMVDVVAFFPGSTLIAAG